MEALGVPEFLFRRFVAVVMIASGVPLILR